MLENQEHRMPMLLVHIRMQKIGADALARAYRHIAPERFQRLMITVLVHPQCGNRPTTVLHTLFRYCNWRVMQLIVNECLQDKLPRLWFDAREPATDDTVLHILAQRVPNSLVPLGEDVTGALLGVADDDNDATLERKIRDAENDQMLHLRFVEQLVRATPRLLLAAPNALGLSVVHYLGINNYRSAYNTVERLYSDLCVTAASEGSAAGTPQNLIGRRTEQLLSISTDENVRLRQTLRATQRMASELQSMHEELNRRIQRGQLGAALAQEQLQKLTTKQHSIDMQRTEVQAAIGVKDGEIERLRAERDASNATAVSARAEFAAANEKLRRAEEERKALRDDLERERKKIEAYDVDIRAAEEDNQRLAEIIRERTRQHAEEIAATAVDTADHADVRYAALMKQLEEERQALAARLAATELEKSMAQSAKAAIEHKIEARVAVHRNVQSLYDEARKRSEDLEQRLAESNAKQREATVAVELMRDQLQALAQERATTAETYARRASENAVERDKLATALLESQAMLQAAQRALATEKEANARHAAAFEEIKDVEREKEFHDVANERERALLTQVEEMKRIVDASETRAAALRQQEEEGSVLTRLLQQRHEEEMNAVNARLEEATNSLIVAQRRASQIEAASGQSSQKLEEQKERARLLQKQIDDQQRLIAEHAPSATLSPAFANMGSGDNGGGSGGGGSGASTPRRDAARERTMSRKMSRLFIVPPPLPADNTAPTPHSTLRAAGSADGSGTSSKDDEKQPAETSPSSTKVDPDEDMSAQRTNALNNEEFMEAVCDMVSEGNTGKITMYLNDGLSPNTQDFFKRPLLEVAVRRIAELYAKPKPNDVDRKTLKMVTQMIPLLLQRGGIWKEVDTYLQNELGHDDKLPIAVYDMLRKRDDMSPFSVAMARGQFQEAIKHIGKVEDVNRVPTTPDKYFREGFSYLHIAVFEESAMMVQVLMQHGANANVVDVKKRTPLHLLLVKCKERKLRLSITQFLMAGGASVKVGCSYQKLVDDCKKRMEAIAPGSTTAHASTTPSNVDVARKLSTEMEKYGTPLKLAESLGDPELLECMQNRRYLAVQKSTLVEYIKNFALLQSRVETAIAEGVCKENQRIYLLYRRYRDVFLAFNPRHNYVTMQCSLQTDADVDRVHDAADVVERKMKKMLSADAEYLIQYMQSGGARSKTLDQSLASNAGSTAGSASTVKTHANATFEWSVGDILVKCVDALEKRWFDVSALIQQRATELYGEAVLDAVCELVRTDQAQAVNTILCRPFDKLFGVDVNLNALVERRLKFTAIELAAYCGAINTLESLMSQQHYDITRRGVTGRTIAQIAVRGQQPLSLVAIDMFMYRNMMTEQPHTHCEDYGICTEELDNSVLHEAARTSRDDLMRHCIDQVRFQLQRKNKGGQTPLNVADQMIHWGMPTRKIEMAKMACKQILTDAIEGKSFWKDSPGGGGGGTLRRSTSIDPSLLMVPDRVSNLPAPTMPPLPPSSAKSRRPTAGRHQRPAPTMVALDLEDIPADLRAKPSALVPPPVIEGSSGSSSAPQQSSANNANDDEMASLGSDEDNDGAPAGDSSSAAYPIATDDEAPPTHRSKHHGTAEDDDDE